MSKLQEGDLMNRILDKLDKLDDRLVGIDKTLVKQEENLEEHMKRSDLLEFNHDLLKSEMKPLITAYTVAWGVCKLVLGSSILLGILKLLS